MKVTRKNDGLTRLVFLWPQLGIAIKVARFHPRKLWKHWKDTAEVKHWIIFRQRWEWNPECRGTTGWHLFSGLYANLNEFLFWTFTRHPLLQPTYFSLFGIVNIQKLAKPLVPDYDVWSPFFDIAGPEVNKAEHILSKSENFGLGSDGQIKLLDYGGSATRIIVRRYGRAIAERFKCRHVPKA